jgi:signal transduction histidine kinase
MEKQMSKKKNKTNLPPEVVDMMSKAAHDIRSPLATLKLIIPVLEGLSEENKMILDMVTERIECIASDFLSQTKKHKQSLQIITYTKLIEIINQLIAEKKFEYTNESGIEFSLNHDLAVPQDCIVKIDSSELKRILSNLLNNAVEAINDDGRIVISLRTNQHTKKSQSDVLQIIVSDNGKGIPPEILPQLMQKGATFGKKDGRGLGLYHAKKTIEDWGGTLMLTSEIDVGTSVIISLPLKY